MLSRIFPLFACVFATVGLLACSGGDRPPPAGDSAAVLYENEAAGEPMDGVPDPEATTREPLVDALGNPRTLCTPRDARECRWYYTDSNGQAQCPLSFQLCRLDGKEWMPCGEYTFDASGDIVPR